MQQWYNGWNEQCCYEVDDACVADHITSVAVQFVSHNRCSGCCGTYHAHHCALNNYPSWNCGETDDGNGHDDERKCLDCEQLQLPTVWTQGTWVDFAECKEKHCEDECRLHHTGHIRHQGVCRVEGMDADIDEIRCHARNHGYGKCPVLDESYDAVSFHCLDNYAGMSSVDI